MEAEEIRNHSKVRSLSIGPGSLFNSEYSSRPPSIHSAENVASPWWFQPATRPSESWSKEGLRTVRIVNLLVLPVQYGKPSRPPHGFDDSNLCHPAVDSLSARYSFSVLCAVTAGIKLAIVNSTPNAQWIRSTTFDTTQHMLQTHEGDQSQPTAEEHLNRRRRRSQRQTRMRTKLEFSLILAQQAAVTCVG